MHDLDLDSDPAPSIARPASRTPRRGAALRAATPTQTCIPMHGQGRNLCGRVAAVIAVPLLTAQRYDAGGLQLRAARDRSAIAGRHEFWDRVGLM